VLKAIYQSVFKPGSLLDNPEGISIVNKYGWLFIVLRWSYYSVIFSFRDYHGAWKPFVSPPFGLDLDTYAFLQTRFSLFFGIFLMLAMSATLGIYFRLINKNISVAKVFNILGVTFFLPFVIVQPIDIAVISTIGWQMLPVVPIHTAILLWESFAATSIISSICQLKWSEKVVSIVVLMAVWILISGALWR